MRSLSPSPILFTTTNKSSILFLLHDKKNSQDNSEEWLDIHLQNCLTLLKDEVKFAQLREKILLNYLARLDSVVSRAHHLTSFAMTAQDYSVMMKLARDWNTLSSQEVIAVLQRFFPSISTKKEPLN
jgi:predicted Zn-dependent peptidase